MALLYPNFICYLIIQLNFTNSWHQNKLCSFGLSFNNSRRVFNRLLF